MRMRLMVVAALVALPGCARPSRSAPAAFAGAPTLPAAFRVADESTPPLPARGPIGRGALLYRSTHNPDAPVLVLESGRQFQLPATPPGEGRQGALYATLSPDGHWLGRRVPGHTWDTRYVLQELTGARVVETRGLPLLWSTNGQYLVMTLDEQLIGPAAGSGQTPSMTLVEPATGRMTSMGAARYRGGLGLTGVLPGGQQLFTAAWPRSLRLRTDGADKTVVADATVVFAAGPEDECWCPQPAVHLSPDGRTVAVQLAYENGLIPGTGAKTRPMPSGSVMIAVIDRSSGTVLHRVKPPGTGPTDVWGLLSDTGSGLLMQSRDAAGEALIFLDPATGSQRLATKLPDGVTVGVPGQIVGPSDG